MKVFEVTIGDKLQRVFAEKRGGVLWLHYEGRTRSYDLRRKAAGGARKGPAQGNGEITAPMPGKILKVNAQPGAQVEAKQVLVVMEAMKMEYSLSSDVAGTVKAVNCKDGDQVELGAVLVTVEPAKKDE